MSVKDRRLRLRGRLRKLLGVGKGDPQIRTFTLMKADNDAAIELYRAGKFWSGINEDFEDLIWAGALPDVRNEYFNRRFAGPDPSSRQVYGALLRLYYQKLLESDADGFLATAAEPAAGGAGDQEVIDGRPMSLDFLQSVDEMFKLRKAWSEAGRDGSPRLVVELGAGYGRLAYVCRRMLPGTTYVILDLPEALTCAASWLGRVLNGEVVPYAEGRATGVLTREKLLARKVWTLGVQQIEDIAPGAVDAFVNVFGFAEMPRRSIENYFGHVDRIVDGVFYSKQREREVNAADGLEVTVETYPVRPVWRELFRGKSSLYDGFFEVAYAIGK